MPSFYMECYNGLKWVKREYSLPQILNLSLSKCFYGNFVNRTQIEGKIPSHSKNCVLGEGSLLSPPTNSEGLKGIQHCINMVLDTSFHISFMMTVYYKMRGYYYKMWQKFIKKRIRFFIAKCDTYYKMRRFHKLRKYTIEYAFILSCQNCKYGREKNQNNFSNVRL